jgi:hypothetical protein
MRTEDADSAHKPTRLDTEIAAAAAVADLRKFLRDRFDIQAPCSIDERMTQA